MEVILLEKVKNLGNLGEKVSVKPGYGRNYLIPQNKAVFATEKNIIRFEAQRAEFEKKAQAALSEAQQRAAKINEMNVQISAQASEEGKLYGSVGITEIKAAMEEKSVSIDKREIVMPEGSLHSVGDYVVEIHLHSDVIASLQVSIVAA